ncbi:MAG: c-type cytochrome [Deltaproteobacteria bacterium]
MYKLKRKQIKEVIVIGVLFGLVILLSAFMTSCTQDENREDEVVEVENENVDTTTEDEEAVESLQNEVEEAETDNDKDPAKASPAEGKEIFAQNCTPCHGQDGTGEGPTAAALDPKPRDLTDASYVSTLSNEHLFKVISGGGLAVGKSAAMPAWSNSLSDDDIQDVISYIRKDLCNCEFESTN